MYLFKALLLVLVPIIAFSSELVPFDLKYPTATESSKLKEERYDKLEVYTKGIGYQPFYGHTWYQEFKYPKFTDDNHNKAVKDFLGKRLNIKESDISKDDFGHFKIDSKEYWLKLNISAESYEYTLLRIEESPDIVQIATQKEYLFTEKYQKRFKEKTFPKNFAIASAEGFAINRVDYKNYDEYAFYYDKKSHTHKGQYWGIDYKKTVENDEFDYRYIIIDNYKNQILKHGGSVLKLKGSNGVFKINDEDSTLFINVSSDSNAFSINIIKEEAFKQSLVLSPDKIKSELDKNGKITLDGIYFDYDKATLKKESAKAILSTVSLMQKYPDLVLSVHGHTDYKGNDLYNQKLSTERAKAVKEAIEAKDIDSARLSSKGFGETKPIASNENDAGRAKNRRVELHKVSGGNKKAIITIDFIKPLPNSVVDSKYSYKDSSLNIQYTKPYSKKKELKEFKGHLEVINYNIMSGSKVDNSISRKEIIKNYENILELYNAEIVGLYSNTLYFKIKDRGDGVSVYGLIDGCTGGYSVKFIALM